MKSPIFIFSLPRSGSTLLQRILLSHKAIGGTSEPWLLLPLIYSINEKGGLSEYSSKLSNKGITDFLNLLPKGKEIYYREIGKFSVNIYSEFLKDGEIYFLDKTPRYYYIIDEIYNIFPNAKFVFLFRDPIQIYASILTTWCGNKFFNLYGSHNDLHYGFKKLSKSFRKYQNNKNTFKINYDDLVNNPQSVLKSLQDFLEIDYDKDLEFKFVHTDISRDGVLGDPTGVKKYGTISSESLNTWKQVFNTRYRKRIIKRYIKRNISNEDLKTQGFNKKNLLKEINELNTSGKYNFLSDWIGFVSYRIIIRFNLYIYFSKSTSWVKKTFLS